MKIFNFLIALLFTILANTAFANFKAYVTNFIDNTVSVINTANNTVIATIPVGTDPLFVAITPDGTKAYVTNRGADTVSVINTTTNTVLTTIAVGWTPTILRITPDGLSTGQKN